MSVSQGSECIEIEDKHIVTWAQPIFLSYQEGDYGVCQTFGVCPDFDLVAEDCKVCILASLRGPCMTLPLLSCLDFTVQQRGVNGAAEEDKLWNASGH